MTFASLAATGEVAVARPDAGTAAEVELTEAVSAFKFNAGELESKA